MTFVNETVFKLTHYRVYETISKRFTASTSSHLSETRYLLNRDAVEHRAAVCGEIFEHNAVDIRDPAKNLQYRWIRAGDWKLIVPNRERVPDWTIELYNLKTDPQEVANLASKQPDRVASLQKMLDAAWPGK